MESIPVYPGTRQSDFSRFSRFAMKDFPELTILTLAGDTTDKILQFVASVERFIRAYNRKIKMRFTVVAAEMAQYYMLDPLKSGSEQTMLIAERYNNEVQTIPERHRLATDVHSPTVLLPK
ncbi:hypothetical protein BGZ88_003363 [Linnemannia elongata]|nr:hypothetical protein BGZ88_003363 [Linnemannia elongata]